MKGKKRLAGMEMSLDVSTKSTKKVIFGKYFQFFFHLSCPYNDNNTFS